MHQTTIRVRYAETDQMGVVYYANYYVWMEIGRVEFVRSLGLAYRDIEETAGLLLSVVESQCRYLSPARYDQQIVIQTGLTGVNPKLIEFTYNMACAASGQALARGGTKHIWVNRQFRPTRLPDHFLNLLKANMECTR